MYRFFVFTLLLSLSFGCYSQDLSSYLKGAVHEVDGRVAFSKTITTNKPVSAKRLFGIMEKWAKENYTGQDNTRRNKVALSDSVTNDIVCLGDKLLIFKRTFAVIDETNMLYQLFFKVADNKCDVTVKNITYKIFGSKNNEYVPAEEMITDKYALNKKGDGFTRNAKYRVHTIDSINSIFTSVDVYLNGKREIIKEVKGAIE
ncbi:DUF4468 domain-containing protein [Viscerimonas tarda]